MRIKGHIRSPMPIPTLAITREVDSLSAARWANIPRMMASTLKVIENIHEK
jgi:hypothetical protein